MSSSKVKYDLHNINSNGLNSNCYSKTKSLPTWSFFVSWSSLIDHVTTTPIMIGVIILSIIMLGILTTVSIVSLFTLVANIAQLCQAGFFLFSLFTWIHLVVSHLKIVKYLDDYLIFSTFLLAFASEFIVQFIVFNCWNTSLSPSNTVYSSLLTQHQVESFLFVITFICLALLIFVFSDRPAERVKIYLRLSLLVTLTRFYGSITFG